MPTVALQAHFDGEHIVLDEKFELPVNASLIVTFLPASEHTKIDSEGARLHMASSSGPFAFLADFVEDIYSTEDGKPFSHTL